jgi:DivIVA domain-containing protein
MSRSGLTTIVLVLSALMLTTAPTVSAGATHTFPPGYEGYHTYAEVDAFLDQIVATYGQGPGAIVKRYTIGKSFEGRDIWALKISDNVAKDESEPEVLSESGMHSREHITVEMNVYLVSLLTDNYGQSTPLGQRVTKLVNTREIWVIPEVNPDGAEYDIEGGTFHKWRKDRFDNPDAQAMGIDLNRNFGFMWGSKGSSGKPGSGQYRGQFPFQAPEAAVLRDFMLSRRIGGQQQLTAVFNWHSYGEFVMWPYGYTKEDVPPTMTADDHAAFVALAKKMASLNGYKAHQGSDSYIYSGDFPAWAYGDQRTFVFTFEMYPPWGCNGCHGFYPPYSVVQREIERNREATLYLIEQADCPYRSAGLAAQNCGPLYDDFEIDRGWRVDPAGTDTATDGMWERDIPAAVSDANGVKQNANVPSGQADMVTGHSAGASADANDVDGGTTSVRSPAFSLGSGSWNVSFKYAFGHDASSGPEDFVRLSVISGGTTTPVWTVTGDNASLNAPWSSQTVSLSAWHGKKVRLLFEARDGGTDSVVEAAVDDVRVTKP